MTVPTPVSVTGQRRKGKAPKFGPSRCPVGPHLLACVEGHNRRRGGGGPPGPVRPLGRPVAPRLSARIGQVRRSDQAPLPPPTVPPGPHSCSGHSCPPRPPTLSTGCRPRERLRRRRGRGPDEHPVVGPPTRHRPCRDRPSPTGREVVGTLVVHGLRAETGVLVGSHSPVAWTKGRRTVPGLGPNWGSMG